ncbi:chemoreceptor glutamine deamidase CheD [Chitinibacteraceae bacterium HSL-7]
MSVREENEIIAPAIYFDRHFNIEAAKISPGEYFVTTRDMLIVTVLGSCVAACIRDPGTGVGGMNHFMLPENHDSGGVVSESARYGTYAMEMLINHVLKHGGRRNRLEAKVFGGGAVLRGFTVNDVGRRNSEFVRRFLDLEHIPITAEDLTGIYPRKVYYFPATGRVLVKKLRSVHNDTIVQRERDYSTRIAHQDVGGNVELF